MPFEAPSSPHPCPALAARWPHAACPGVPLGKQAGNCRNALARQWRGHASGVHLHFKVNVTLTNCGLPLRQDRCRDIEYRTLNP